MFISYSQNCEDVVLWRVLGHIAQGTYVDVGAADPTEYSVTKAFYDRGWSGVNIEPATHYVERLLIDRPRDTTIAKCAGEQAGHATLHLIVDTGLSTLSDNYLSALADNDFVHQDVDVEVERLDDMLDTAGLSGREIHFLKIDVEGGEEAVLRGIDFETWRPWVVVVEATEPLTTAPAYESWEPILTAHNYEFCLFDGLNRFYFAREHAELRHSLSYPVCIFDQPYTVGAGDRELAAIAEATIAERDELLRSYRALDSSYQAALAAHEVLDATHKSALAAYEGLHTKYDEALLSYARLQAEYHNAVEGYDRLHVLYDNALASADAAQASSLATSLQLQQAVETAAALAAELEAIRNSASWKVTQPLRSIRHVGKG